MQGRALVVLLVRLVVLARVLVVLHPLFAPIARVAVPWRPLGYGRLGVLVAPSVGLVARVPAVVAPGLARLDLVLARL